MNGRQLATSQRRIDLTASPGRADSNASQIHTTERPPFSQPLQQPAKDPRSFTQALFDALPVRLLEWMPRLPQISRSQKQHVEGRRSTYIGPELDKTKLNRKPVGLEGTDKHTAAPGKHGEEHDKTSSLHSTGSVAANGHAKQPARRPHRRTSCSDMTLNNDEHDATLASLSASEEVHPKTQAEPPHDQSDESQTRGTLEGHCTKSPPPSRTEAAEQTSLSVPTLTCLSTEILTELKDLHSEWEKEPSDSWLSNFSRQSLYFCLKDPYRLSASFEAPIPSSIESDFPSDPGTVSHSPKINVQSVGLNLSSMSALSSWPEIFKNLSIAVHGLHIPTASTRTPHPAPSLSDWQAARVCVIALYALSELVMAGTSVRNHALPMLFDHVRARGRVHSFRDEVAEFDLQPFMDPGSLWARKYGNFQSGVEALDDHILELCDVFDDSIPLSLLERILSVVANRWTHLEICKARKRTDLSNLLGSKAPNIMQSILKYMADDANERPNIMTHLIVFGECRGQSETLSNPIRTNALSRLTLYWLRTLMLRDWDGRTSIRKSDTIGTILQILAAMYEKRYSLGLEPREFWTPVFFQRFDSFDMPMEWLEFQPDNRTVHLLSYSFLFQPDVVVNYFRSINYSRMMKSMERANLKKRAYSEFIVRAEIPVARRERLEERLEIPGPLRFLIKVRRDNVLTDAIDQIWRRPKHELLRPLKVRMGMDEGEEGVDVGGVQQEMFRVLFGQALDPSHGMFTVDEETRMTWFQPESLEPLFKFEALGVLMSLAVYNSITLPITFPIAFYRKLLGLKVKKVDHVRDGWPQLAKHLQGLLDWKDGDVADVHIRTYEFTYEVFGRIVSVDILRHGRDLPWPPVPSRKGKEKVKTASFDVPPVETSDESGTSVWVSPISRMDAYITNVGHRNEPSEAPLVTNANREQYVKDYVFWLTDKSVRPQYEAFARGFYTCLDRTALSIFTAEALQSFIEGIQEIDIDGLQESTIYQEYKADDQVVIWFWEVVKSWDHHRHKLLLEFVTASDRVPVNGVRAIRFGIQKEGPVDERLPSSHTCFGTLLLPQYSSKEVLERMLGIAVEQAKGFGTI